MAKKKKKKKKKKKTGRGGRDEEGEERKEREGKKKLQSKETGNMENQGDSINAAGKKVLLGNVAHPASKGDFAVVAPAPLCIWQHLRLSWTAFVFPFLCSSFSL